MRLQKFNVQNFLLDCHQWQPCGRMQCMQLWREGAAPPGLHEVIPIHDNVPAVGCDAEVALMRAQPLLLMTKHARCVRTPRAHPCLRLLRTARRFKD